jgi:hypothetical protein
MPTSSLVPRTLVTYVACDQRNMGIGPRAEDLAWQPRKQTVGPVKRRREHEPAITQMVGVTRKQCNLSSIDEMRRAECGVLDARKGVFARCKVCALRYRRSE